MLRLTGFLICPTMDEADRVSHLLPAELARWKAEPGCLDFEVNHAGAMTWDVSERFRDRASFEAHQARARASEWGRRTLGIAREFTVSEG